MPVSLDYEFNKSTEVFHDINWQYDKRMDLFDK